ncbi:MAG: polysaccharide biosynthesis tyrosine autokinase [Anaerolineaceae bacterium]|jgi:capsular exopolysaccharide synthesis family protein|nr:MAG: polysaccharide biosynthesis tyrosine autokinase [Anaerolineaceae bacterium]
MEDETIDLRQYGLLLKRWSWLLVLSLVIGAATGLIVSLLSTPIFQSTAKVMITRAGQDQSSDVTAYLTTNQQTQTYLQLLQTESILNIVSERLGFELDEDAIDTKAIIDTQIIEINVEDPDPQRAALTADMLVEVLIEQNELISSERYDLMEESLSAQKAQIESQIADLQNQINHASIKTIEEQEQWIQEQINVLQQESETLPVEISQMGNPATPEERDALEQKKARLEQVELLLPLYEQSYTDLIVYGKQVDGANTSAGSQLTLLNTTQSLYQQIYVSVLNNLESVRLAKLQNMPNVVQIQPAIVPDDPVRPRTMLNSVLGGIIALILSAGFLILKENLDTTMKTSAQVEELLKLNVIGYIAEMQNSNGETIGLYTTNQPRSPIAEAFRSLRTNIEFSSIDKPIRTILVTSPEVSTGKTIISTNLAAIYAQKGEKVLLLDADLRRPRVHKTMGITNHIGLTDLLRGSHDLQDVIQKMDGAENLTIVSSGSLPPNPAELLGSARMEQILLELGNKYNIIVIDSPPSIVADSQILSSKVDAVLLVIQPGKTSKEAAKATEDLIKRAGGHIIGVVFNRIPRDRVDYYSGNYQYQYYSKD